MAPTRITDTQISLDSVAAGDLIEVLGDVLRYLNLRIIKRVTDTDGEGPHWGNTVTTYHVEEAPR